jgi:hypothetical protein
VAGALSAAVEAVAAAVLTATTAGRRCRDDSHDTVVDSR